MPKTKVEKAAALDILTQAVKNPLLVFTTFSGLKVSDDQTLRRACKKADVTYLAVKKTLLEKALQAAGLPGDVSAVVGNLGMATSDETLGAAKEIFNFAKKNEGLKIVGGIFEGKFLSADEVKTLATIPGRCELYGQLVAVMSNPLRNTVGLFSVMLRNFVGVLNAIATR